MATAYSQPLQYTPYQEQYNKELLSKALQYKQDKYDTNRQQIKNTIAQVSNIDLIKDQDAEYLHDKMQSVINTLNTQGAGDLSLDTRTDYLTGYVANLADQRVMNGYLGTRSYRNVQSEYEKAKENGEDSAENLAYSLRDINSWINDGQTGSALPAGANTYYVPFVDKMSVLQDVAGGLEANSVVRFEKFGSSPFTWLSQDGDVLDPARLKSAFNLKLESNPKLKNQFRVDAWATNYGITDEQFILDYRDGLSDTLENLNDQRGQIAAKAGTSPNKSTRDQFKEQLNYLDEAIAEYQGTGEKSDEEILKNRENLEFFAYKENYLNDLANVLSYEKMNAPTLEYDRGAIAQMEESGRNSRHRKSEENADARALRDRMIKIQDQARAAHKEISGEEDETRQRFLTNLYSDVITHPFAEDILAQTTYDSERGFSQNIVNADGSIDFEAYQTVLNNIEPDITQAEVELGDVGSTRSPRDMNETLTSYRRNEVESVEKALSAVYDETTTKNMVSQYKNGSIQLTDIENALDTDILFDPTTQGVLNLDDNTLEQRAYTSLTTSVASARENSLNFNQLAPRVQEAFQLENDFVNNALESLEVGEAVRINTAALAGDGRDTWITRYSEDMYSVGGRMGAKFGESGDETMGLDGAKARMKSIFAMKKDPLIEDSITNINYAAAITDVTRETPNSIGLYSSTDIGYDSYVEQLSKATQLVEGGIVITPQMQLDLGNRGERQALASFTNVASTKAKDASEQNLSSVGIDYNMTDGGVFSEDVAQIAPADYVTAIASTETNLKKLTQGVMSSSTENTEGAETHRTTGDDSITYLPETDEYLVDLGMFTTGKYKDHRAAYVVSAADVEGSGDYGVDEIAQLKSTYNVKERAAAQDNLFFMNISPGESYNHMAVPKITVTDNVDENTKYQIGVDQVYNKDENGNERITANLTVQRKVNGDNFVYANRQGAFTVPLLGGQEFTSSEEITLALIPILQNQTERNQYYEYAVEQENKVVNRMSGESGEEGSNTENQ